MTKTRAHRGTGAFIALRATSALLLPLVVWFVWAVVARAGATQAEILDWLSRPAAALPFALFIALSAWHMAMGMAEVIEDYVHSGWKGVFQTLNWLVALAVAGAAAYAGFLLAFTSE